MSDGRGRDRADRVEPAKNPEGEAPRRRRPTPDDAWPLVGRADELAVLDSVAGDVLSGRTRVVRLDGPAGLGKSALLSSWLDRARHFRVLRIRCRRMEREFAFGAVRRMFGPFIAAATDSDRRFLLDGAGDAVLRILDPVGPGADEPGAYAAQPQSQPRSQLDVGPAPAAAEVLPGLDNLALRLCLRQPLLLAIDDLQWIDPPSLRWLAHLVHRAEARQILLVATTRTGESPVPGQLFNELVHPSICRTVVLDPLDVGSVERLVAAVFDEPRPDASFCAACHSATDGHPLFLRALLCDARRGGLRPTKECQEQIRSFGLQTLHQEIRHRLCQGSTDMVELARGLAVLGDRTPPALLAAYCGKGEAVIRAAAAGLQSFGLLRSGDDLCAVHPVVREVLLAELSPQDVGAAHGRAARVLHLSGRPDEEVAAHLMAAGPVPGTWSLPVLRRAAEEAMRRGAAETAVTYLRHAVHQPVAPAERTRLLVDLAIAASHYNGQLAVSYAMAALEGPAVDTTRSEAVGVLTYSLLLSRVGHSSAPELDRLLTELTARTEHASCDRELLLRMYALRSWLEFERPSTPSPDPGSAHRPPMADDVAGNTPGERQLLAIRAFDALRAAEPAPYVAELVDLASVNLPTFSHDLFPQHYFVAQSLLYLDDLDRADALSADLLRETKGRGIELLASSLLIYRAGIALRRGNVADAVAAAQTASEAGCATGQPPFRMTLDTIRIEALIEQGRLQAAEQIATAYSTADPGDASWEWPRFLMSLAALRTARGDLRAGLSLLRECGHHFEAAGTLNPVICPWRSRAAAVHLAMGRREEAQALVEEELVLARRCRIPRALGVALLASGVAAGGAPGLDLLAEAVGVLDRTPARLDLARALHEYGRALLRREDRRGARPVLRRGLDIAAGCGATVLTQRLGERLYEAGGRACGRGEAASVLTASEERVSSLAARGYSNKEIAGKLFVSLRTVETHLTGAYRKLGITGRSELIALRVDAPLPLDGPPRAEGAGERLSRSGPQGPQGLQGPQGSQGSQGPRKQRGQRGQRGPQGPQAPRR